MNQLERLLKTLLAEFEWKISEKNTWVPRQQQLHEAEQLIQVIIGMRRSGKTTILLQKIQALLMQGVPLSSICYFNFEDDRLLPCDQHHFAELLEGFYRLNPESHDQLCYFFLDEVQNIDEWPLVIRRFMDTKKVRIYITGSSAKLLSKEIATSLRGRCLTTEIYPFSFSEYLAAHDYPALPQALSTERVDKGKKILLEYLNVGGFPAVQQLSVSDRRQILQSYVDTVVYRDIIERYQITNMVLIKYLVKTMINHAGRTYSPNKFYNDLKSQGIKASKDTVYEAIGHIEDAFLAFTVPLYSESLRKTQVNPKKIYAIDTGLVQAYHFGFSEHLGQLFENLFYIELRRRGHQVFYYRTQDNYEVDFYTQDPEGKLHLYQLVWTAEDAGTLAREQRALDAATKELKVDGELIDVQAFLENWV